MLHHVAILILMIAFNALEIITFPTKSYAENKINSFCPNIKKEGFRIFISFSMPESLMINLDQQAKKIGAKLVIRGLKNNSFKETFSYVKSMNEKGMVIDIDPKSFEEFDITQVPAFVINQNNQYDKLVGNVSIAYVLKQFAEIGDLKDLASEYLRRLENENK